MWRQIATLGEGESFGANSPVTASIVCNRASSELLVLPIDVYTATVKPAMKVVFSMEEITAVFRKKYDNVVCLGKAEESLNTPGDVCLLILVYLTPGDSLRCWSTFSDRMIVPSPSWM